MTDIAKIAPLPLPLRTDPDCGNETVLGRDGFLFADCSIFGPGTSEARNQRNAAFIVLAVNSHAANEAKIAALVAALEEAQHYVLYTAKGCAKFLSEEAAEDDLKKISAALALAKGQTT